MKSKNLYKEYSYISSIRENLQIIEDIFFDHNSESKNQLSSESKAQLIKAIEYLDKEKNSLPNFYKKEIDIIIKAARLKLSHIKNS